MIKRVLTILMFALLTSLTSFSQSSPINRITAYLKNNYPDASDASRHFIYNAIDLNDDGKDEYLVGLIGGDWCGSGGCTVLVFNNAIKLTTRMTVVNYPIYVGAPGGKEVTKGYSNLYIENKDGSIAKMAWNGTKYPTNPSIAPKVDKKVITGKFKFLNIEEQDQIIF